MEHEAILRAIIERDGKMAEALALAHARDAAQGMVGYIPATTFEAGAAPRNGPGFKTPVADRGATVLPAPGQRRKSSA